MTKKELVERLSERGYDISKTLLARIICDTFDCIDDTVSAGETVCVSGRRFKLVVKPARMGRNPKTQAPLQIPEKRYVSYRKPI
jgi:integration host factor subunit beta